MKRIALLVLILLLAVLSWSAMLLFTYTVPPRSSLTFGIFFLLLGLALWSTVTPLAYGIELLLFPKIQHRALRKHAARQGILLALVVILNLIFRALHSWNIFMAVIILGAAGIVELLSMARK